MSDRSDRSNRARSEEPLRDGGPGEAAHFIAASVADLVAVARHHKLDMLGYLLEMAQMEAEERVRLLTERKAP